jgi:hypothetical protein
MYGYFYGHFIFMHLYVTVLHKITILISNSHTNITSNKIFCTTSALIKVEKFIIFAEHHQYKNSLPTFIILWMSDRSVASFPT